MDGQTPPYESPNARLYQPLSRPDSIRILTLFECVNEEDDIEGHLTEIRLSDVKSKSEGYTALSYARGDPTFTHTIWLGDQALLISANVEAALRHLRRQDIPIRIWIDAVCINESDIPEKNHQVEQMRNIYSSASETIIWLGEASGNTSVSAWNFLERHSTWALNDRRERDTTIPAKLEESLLSFRGEFRDVEIDVLSRPWFQRLWVFGEAVLSRTLYIQCGHRRIAWDDFSKTVFKSDRHYDRYGFSAQHTGKRSIVGAITLARHEYQHLQKHGPDESSPGFQQSGLRSNPLRRLDILKLVDGGRYLKCSDARDRIFAFMGIAQGIGANDPIFRIDYGLDTRSLYVQFARNIIEATKSLDILAYVNVNSSRPERYTEDFNMPSWAPRWDFQSATQHFGHSCRTIQETFPPESDEGSESRRRRIASSDIVWSLHQSDSGIMESMEVSGRVVGRIGPPTAAIWLDSKDQELFKHLVNLSDREDERFTLSMSLWSGKLTLNDYGLHTISDTKPAGLARNQENDGEGPGYEDEDDWVILGVVSGPEDLKGQRLHLTQATIHQPNLLVQQHLYRRGLIASDWTSYDIDRDIPFSMKRSSGEASIIDGRSLAVCVKESGDSSGATEDTAGDLALVPGTAKEGDMIIQISGARVPFVVRERPKNWSGFADAFAASRDGATPEGNHHKIPLESWASSWTLIGDCLLNGFEELAEDAMDRRFRLI